MKKALTLAVTGVLAIGVVGAANGADGIQTIQAKLTPTKLPKKTYKPAKIAIDIATQNNDENSDKGEQPPSADRTRVDFPKNMKFNTAAVPRCKVTSDQLENQTPEKQRELCGPKSKVSLDKGTSAEVIFDATPAGPSGDSYVIPVGVQAFNGHEKDTLYLTTDPQGVATKPVLVGKLKKSDAGRGYGRQLDVTIPDLPVGAISDFKTTVKAKDYVQARCKSKTNKFQARTDYENHSSTTATDTTKCKRKAG